jgi:Flp pilus assembly protein TadB
VTRAAAATVLAAALLLVWPAADRPRWPGQPARAGRTISGRTDAGHAGTPRRRWPAAVIGPRRHRLVAAAGTAIAVTLLGGARWVALAPVVGAAAHLGIGWLQARAARLDRRRAAATLPLGFDLLATCLRSGAPTGPAAGVVGAALGDAVGARFCAVERALRLGAEPARAWAPLAEIGPAEAVRAASRSADSGADLARALSRLAARLRSERADAAEAAVRRAGVLVVLPLGLCFLPAFVCTGVVPLVIGVLGNALR